MCIKLTVFHLRFLLLFFCRTFPHFRRRLEPWNWDAHSTRRLRCIRRDFVSAITIDHFCFSSSITFREIPFKYVILSWSYFENLKRENLLFWFRCFEMPVNRRSNSTFLFNFKVLRSRLLRSNKLLKLLSYSYSGMETLDLDQLRGLINGNIATVKSKMEPGRREITNCFDILFCHLQREDFYLLQHLDPSVIYDLPNPPSLGTRSQSTTTALFSFPLWQSWSLCSLFIFSLVYVFYDTFLSHLFLMPSRPPSLVPCRSQLLYPLQWAMTNNG